MRGKIMKDKIKRPVRIKPVNNFALLFVLSLLTGFAGANCGDAFEPKVMIALALLIATEWVYLIFFYTVFHRRNFELEIIAFFLSGVGLVTIGSKNADDA